MAIADLWTAAFQWGIGFSKPRDHRAASIDLSRLGCHDLADLNLPSDIRAGIELRRAAETHNWLRSGDADRR